MAILLKELTLRYSPKGDDISQLLKDYYAVYGIWQDLQSSGGAGLGGERKAEIVNDAMHQVGKMTGIRVLERLAEMEKSGALAGKDLNKTIPKFTRAVKMEDWQEVTASLSEILRQAMRTNNQSTIKMWTGAKNTEVSPSLWSLFGGRPPTPTKPEPKWKAYDKPMTGSPVAIQRDLPMAGAQGDLPLKPREKLPQMPKDLPPLQTRGTEPQEVGGNWAQLLNQYGYTWSEPDKAYKSERGVKIQTFANQKATAILPSGKTRDFDNLGILFRTLHHNKNKRHKTEPAAQVTKENYKELYEFLYT